ncbi:MAG: hypothetical protein KL839_03985 [Rhizobium sp.]|nr:hypothetical protein [Rhizobium sp.]
MLSTSHQTSLLAEPEGDARIPAATLGYVTEMAREEVFDMIATACVEAGVQRSQIARRLGKDPATVTRLLSAPGNYTIDTVAEMLFAINGNMFRPHRYAPMKEPRSNTRGPATENTLVAPRNEYFLLWGESENLPAVIEDDEFVPDYNASSHSIAADFCFRFSRRGKVNFAKVGVSR